MRILYVCTANICRSASAQELLLEALALDPQLTGIEVRSAGTHAVTGSPGCAVAPALAGRAQEHQAQPLSGELLEWADLILPAARDHRREILLAATEARTRTFTIRQAARIADWLVDSGMVVAAREGAECRHIRGDPRADVAPLPDNPSARWQWMVSEMDAARGLSGVPGASELLPVVARRRFRLARPARSSDLDPSDAHHDDIPDPHMLGMGLHPMAFEQIASSTDALVRLLRQVAFAPLAGPSHSGQPT